MKLGIVITTYQRPDGNTPSYLTRALLSIKNQIHQDYKVFLIGDKYTDNDEFITLSKSIIPHNKIYYENLPIAVERDRYPQGGLSLWRCGGVNAGNHGISKCYEEGLTYICHLDHDDYWSEDHLSSINHVIENIDNTAAVIYTCSTYSNRHLPPVIVDNEIINDIPKPERTIHSSICIDYSKVYLKYRDTQYEIGIPYPADADLLQRLGTQIIENNLKSYLIKRITCFHPEERSVLKFTNFS